MKEHLEEKLSLDCVMTHTGTCHLCNFFDFIPSAASPEEPAKFSAGIRVSRLIDPDPRRTKQISINPT